MLVCLAWLVWFVAVAAKKSVIISSAKGQSKDWPFALVTGPVVPYLPAFTISSQLSKLAAMSPSTGKLSIVGTPIGNLEDISLRALRVLREADVIAAEDTRHTGGLLKRYELHKPLVSYHEFNEAQRAAELVQSLQKGQQVALVSDAGMPTLSDPGYRLIRAAIAAGIAVEVIPGPSAVTAALAVSGLPALPFLFFGFLPHKSAQRQKTLARLKTLGVTIVFFESPYRLVKTLADLRDCFGERQMVVARELTKKFEEVLRGTPSELLKRLENKRVKGEITVVIEGAHD